MMRTLSFARWGLSSDMESTKGRYTGLTTGAPDNVAVSFAGILQRKEQKFTLQQPCSYLKALGSKQIAKLKSITWRD